MKKRKKSWKAFKPKILAAILLFTIFSVAVSGIIGGSQATHKGDAVIGQVALARDSEKLQGLGSAEILLATGWTRSGVNALSTVSGNVGIGTSAPSAKLDVAGDLKILNGGKIINLRAEAVSSFPATAEPGRILFSSGRLYFYDGTAWKKFGS